MRSESKKHNQVEGFPNLCMFCAKEINEEESSREHFVPKAFFDKAIRDKVVLTELVLPAHEYCNHVEAKDISYARDILSTEYGAEVSKGALALQQNTMQKKLRNNLNELSNEVFKDLTEIPLMTKSGLTIGVTGKYKVDWDGSKKCSSIL